MSAGRVGRASAAFDQKITRSRRLFFSLWPSDEFRVEVEAATRVIMRDSGGRATPPQNFHVTLLFLGQVLESRLDVVQQAGATLAGAASFELNFDRIETLGRSGVLCLTTSAPPGAAIELAAKLQHALRDPLLMPNEREFRPHLTLARDLPRGRAAEPIKTLRWKVNEFVLVESRRDAGGSHYSVLARWPLLSLPPTPDPAVADRE